MRVRGKEEEGKPTVTLPPRGGEHCDLIIDGTLIKGNPMDITNYYHGLASGGHKTIMGPARRGVDVPPPELETSEVGEC